MATQFQQVLEAIKLLGGRGTPKEIYDKIKEITNSEWGTKTPIASVSMYLSRNECFKNEDGIWVLQENKSQNGKSTISGETDKKSLERGLYFITISPYVKPIGAGFLFKIGKSDTAKNRLVAYSASLPVDTVQLISFYPIPNGVDLDQAEKEVNGELLGNEGLGEDIFKHKITIRKYFSTHQREWLQTLDVNPSKEEELNNLARIIDTIVKNTIETLTPKPEEETLIG